MGLTLAILSDEAPPPHTLTAMSPGERLRILLVDDQPMVRSALRAYVESAPDMEVVGEAMSGTAARSQVRALEPDVVLMDLQMPVMDGIEATRAIAADHPDVQILALTSHQSESYVLPALRAGASGYLLKDEEPEDILAAIRTVQSGGSAVSPAIARMLISTVATMGAPGSTVDHEIARRAGLLSDRERDVLEVLCRGRSNREIARELGLTESTVKTHVSSLMAKLQVQDRLQVVVLALSQGLVARTP